MKNIKKCVGLYITLNIFFVFVSAVSDFISISAFASVVGARVSFVSSVVGKKDLCSQ